MSLSDWAPLRAPRGKITQVMLLAGGADSGQEEAWRAAVEQRFIAGRKGLGIDPALTQGTFGEIGVTKGGPWWGWRALMRERDAWDLRNAVERHSLDSPERPYLWVSVGASRRQMALIQEGTVLGELNGVGANDDRAGVWYRRERLLSCVKEFLQSPLQRELADLLREEALAAVEQATLEREMAVGTDPGVRPARPRL